MRWKLGKISLILDDYSLKLTILGNSSLKNPLKPLIMTNKLLIREEFRICVSSDYEIRIIREEFRNYCYLERAYFLKR